ncbi:hypothetical protein D3C84_1151040 [compost metagenome]
MLHAAHQPGEQENQADHQQQAEQQLQQLPSDAAAGHGCERLRGRLGGQGGERQEQGDAEKSVH